MNKCETCTHWNKKPYSDIATCEKLATVDAEQGIMPIITSQEEDDDELPEAYYTGKDFGCIHHESK